VKTLVVAPQPFFSFRGTPFSVYYRTLIAGELGVDTDLLTYGRGSDVELPGCRIYRTRSLRFLGEVRAGPSFAKLVLDVWMIASTVALLIRNRYAVVHAHEEAVFWCMFLKRPFGFRLIYDMHSSLPQQLDNFAYTRSALLRKVFRWLEHRAVRTSDAVITICPALRDYAHTLAPDRDKVHLIENSIIDPVKVKGAPLAATIAPATELAETWLAGRRAARTFLYAGTLEAYQWIDRLLKAMALVAARQPDVSLLVAGGLPRQVEKYRAMAAELGIASSVLFAGQLSQADVR
jgi:glycosyltransferase involved in cell wall biosynthesis